MSCLRSVASRAPLLPRPARPPASLALLSPSQKSFTTSFTAKMPRTAETVSFKFNHTMLRVKDPEASVKFYTEVLGMDLADMYETFALYFLVFNYGNEVTDGTTRFGREGVLELTHNYGTESDPDFKGYASGNSEPGRGFGHIAIAVDDVEKACERFEKLGVKFQKRPSDGKMRHIAFILDPDGYWIEIVQGYYP